ncbi:MAG: aminotransferase class IV [Alphaproteobacteria bacterium]
MSFAYHNGQFVSREDLTINIADFGFSRGVTVHCSVRVYGGAPFHLEDHVKRLARGAEILGIGFPMDQKDFNAALRELVKKNGFSQSILRLYLTAGECGHPSVLSFADCREFTPHLMALEEPFQPQHADAPMGIEAYRRGQKLKTIPFVRELPEVKSTSYIFSFQAAQEHARQGWDDVLFTHPGGYVTEAARSNLFCVIDGALCTPARGMFPGVTRQIILALALRQGIRAEERDISPADLMRATEAFKTGTTQELMPIRQIDEHILPTAMEGPVFSALRKAFTDYIDEYRLS